MSMPSIIHGKGLQMKQQSKRQAVNPYLPLYEYITCDLTKNTIFFLHIIYLPFCVFLS